MPDLQKLLDQVEQIVPEIATAPWFVIDPNEGTEYQPFWQVINDRYLLNPGTDDDVCADVEMLVGRQEDAEFIALSRTALPQLANVITEILAFVEFAEKAHTENDEFDLAVRSCITRIREAIRNGLEDER